MTANTCPTCGRHIPGRKPLLTARQVAAVLRDLHGSDTLQAIADRHHVSRGAVKRIAVKAGIKRRPGRRVDNS
jgi:hypothetical protein